ncbi:MAG TPA: protein-L-isoaspartate O-methyltransferase [Flavobacteriales bacterium]|jgi:protein-L-isoaspartate(D-aspartate) O-methyltransferase|nr:protein-L-isoaspartate(D-aspartate) O-methyltransferase [Salibacteraceae bacterium]HAS36473.1 protein-L-isoaspartate O-methyltransferase [Flavobacteriales bacterium]
MSKNFNDSFRTQGLRKRLLETLRSKGFEDELVLEAMMKMPRHYFFDGAFVEKAYTDLAFPIGAGQTISHPMTVATQSSILEVKKHEKVLEIGTGCGYQTAILMLLGARVWTIERQRELFEKTSRLLPELGFQPKFFYGDGYKGLPSYAPFDKILVTCGAPFVPEDLKSQVKVGGLLVIPVGGDDVQRMIRLRKMKDGTFKREDWGEFRFVPMLEDKE